MRSPHLPALLKRLLARRPWLFVLLGVALVGMLRLGMGPAAPVLAQPSTPSYEPMTTIPATAQQVTTGLYAVNVYNLDASSNTYYLDFYVWFKWKGEIDPIANLEFVNGVEDWGATQVPAYEEPEILPDGSFYQILRVESRFVEPFVLARYPMDQQRLKVTLENSVYTMEQLVYIEDTTDSGVAPTLTIPGWKINSYELDSLIHRYSTRFGDSRPENDAATYSTLQYQLAISRPISFFIWKLLLPLLIVLFSGWGALLLHPAYVDSRILMPVTALLTTVFLQQSYSAALPDVGYLVLLDKIYALAYVLIIAAIMEAIFTADQAHNGDADGIRRVMRFDRYFLIGQTTVLVVGLLLLIIL